MFVTGSAGSFVAGGAVSFMFGNAVSLVVFDSFGFGGTGDLASEVVVHSVAVVGFGHFSVAVAVLLVAEFVFDGHHPGLPLYFYKKMGQFGPHPHFSAFDIVAAWGFAPSWGCDSLYGGLE